MNILFIIGNGFDLNLGMKTKYTDFYKYYQSIDSSSDSIINLKKDISINLKNWSDLELALGKYTQNINSVKEFDLVFEDIGDNLCDFLLQTESNFNFNKIDKKKLFDYFSYPERLLLKSDKDKLSMFKRNWNNSNWNVNVITFNYTRSIEKILGEKPQNLQIGSNNNYKIILQRIEHIHGYANDRMVMGVNDISQIANTSFHTNQDILEALVKNSCNQANKHGIDILCKQQISYANLICIFGSSIGDTDKMWWIEIGKQLLKGSSLIIFELGEQISQRRGYLQARKERNIKEAFLNKTALTNEEKKKAEKNIYVGINTDMFNITIDNVSNL
ncbi:MAG: hypothetical protein D8M58_14815 [Calditrichaeota bacterium]|nr:MAG: hypothetical protein DWQ03_16055 [Calditrichota bacterium]MBL1206675.1 hypothetical protein [Calditrichota bacterium]NOG46502.1 hypothetical protein [Calditrichota bacterium]